MANWPTPSDIAAIRKRVERTICSTFTVCDGEAVERLEGRISAEDFATLIAAAEHSARRIETLDKYGDY